MDLDFNQKLDKLYSGKLDSREIVFNRDSGLTNDKSSSCTDLAKDIRLFKNTDHIVLSVWFLAYHSLGS